VTEGFNTYIDLGGSDCETCGWSYDELTVWQQPNGQWSATLRVGCFGSASFGGTREGLIAWLQEECGSELSASEMKGLIAEISAV